jgi:hypothetical protein
VSKLSRVGYIDYDWEACITCRHRDIADPYECSLGYGDFGIDDETIICYNYEEGSPLNKRQEAKLKRFQETDKEQAKLFENPNIE